ncbi:MAG TPA: D-alanyl-D-alanine carboxypeptidase, partial [Candidatus Kapabacteria bacterium]|nr:D-alanyl-D-alanine carboxypeptidase [Candidatus Kapabacteria bacterium]
SLFQPFYNTMGVAGVDGTIHHRMIGTSAEDDVHAKTGTLNGVSALAGYVNTRDGELWAFDITMNNTRVFSARKVQDKIVELLAGFSYNSNQ